jgi:hypothetical protein
LARDVRLDLALPVEGERYRPPLVPNFDADLDRSSGCGSLDALQGLANRRIIGLRMRSWASRIPTLRTYSSCSGVVNSEMSAAYPQYGQWHVSVGSPVPSFSLK